MNIQYIQTSSNISTDWKIWKRPAAAQAQAYPKYQKYPKHLGLSENRVYSQL